ncbi:MAG: hypothetical protein ACP5T4_01025 [Candidatus Micrarchaeia archaeon]
MKAQLSLEFLLSMALAMAVFGIILRLSSGLAASAQGAAALISNVLVSSGI